MNASILPKFDNFVDSGVEYKEKATYIEEIMNDLMFTIPSEEGVKKVIVTKDFVDGKAEATIIKE